MNKGEYFKFEVIKECKKTKAKACVFKLHMEK